MKGGNIRKLVGNSSENLQLRAGVKKFSNADFKVDVRDGGTGVKVLI